VSLADWPQGAQLARAPRDQQVDGVIAAILGGEASPDTRRVLGTGANPLADRAGAPDATDDFARLIGLALGAPEFQRR
jgi:hypothetical protein